jgi:hypothetical protein
LDDTLRADGISNIDLGIFKNTRIGEKNNLQFRAEFFNATNTRNFGTPNSAINSRRQLPQPVGNQWRESSDSDGTSLYFLVRASHSFVKTGGPAASEFHYAGLSPCADLNWDELLNH